MKPTPAREDVRRLTAIVERFRGRRVAVLGDLVADEFLYGDIERVSREAPVLILRHRRTVSVPGGGGNAVANLRALGADPLPVGVVGRDPAGSRLVAAFARAGIDTSRILARRGFETPTKHRVLAGGVHTRRQQVVRIDFGATHDGLPRDVASALDRSLGPALAAAEGLLVADYGYGAADPARLARLVGPRTKSKPVLVDSRSRIGAFRGVTGATPNQEELERALGLPPLEDDEALARAGARLLRRTGNRAVLVTRGSQGMCLFERGAAPRLIPAYGPDEVADVTGAGDTVIAVFTLALIAGASFADAARLANYAAGIVVMKMGTATLTRRELVRALGEDAAGRC